MTDPSLAETVPKRADQLVVGDRILHNRLPSTYAEGPGEVVFVKPHVYRGNASVFVAYVHEDGYYDSTSYLPDGVIEVFPADTGLGYSRAADGEVTQPIGSRVPAHFGAVEVAGGLVDIDPPVHASEPRELLAIAPSADGGVAFATAPTGAVTDPIARAKAVELTEAVAANPPEGFVPASVRPVTGVTYCTVCRSEDAHADWCEARDGR